jgi:hypothetical protein
MDISSFLFGPRPEQMQKIWEKFDWRPYVSYGSHFNDFHETINCSRTLMEDFKVQQTPNRPRTVQVRLEIRLRPTKVWLVTEQTFTKLMLTVQRSGKKFYIEFHENPTNGLAAATRSQADRQTARRSHDIRSFTLHHTDSLIIKIIFINTTIT